MKENAFAWARRKGIKTIRLGVYQPKVDGHTEHVMTLDELERFAATIHQKAQRVEEAKAKYGVIPIEDWNKQYLNQTPNEQECAFCRARVDCPSAQRTLQEFMMDGFEEIIEGEVTPPADKLPEILAVRNDTLRLQLLNRLFLLAPFVEDMILAVRAEAERVLLLGDDLPDVGLDTGRRGARKFLDAEEVEKTLNKTMRIAREHTHVMKLKTPTQLEELTKIPAPGEKPILGEKQWKKLAAQVTQTDGKPTVRLKKLIKKPYVVEKPSAEGFEAVPTTDDEEQLF